MVIRFEVDSSILRSIAFVQIKMCWIPPFYPHINYPKRQTRNLALVLIICSGPFKVVVHF